MLVDVVEVGAGVGSGVGEATRIGSGSLDAERRGLDLDLR